jgi:NUC194 domain
LRTYLDVLVHAGSLCLLGPLLPALREGPAHRYYSWLTESLHGLAVSISATHTNISLYREYEDQSTGIQKVCGCCLSIASDEGEDFAVKKTFFDSFCVPILSSCSPIVLEDFLSGSWANLKVGPVGENVSVVKKMNEIIQKEVKIGDSTFSTDTLLFLQSCCFKIFQIAYDRLSIGVLKSKIAESFLTLQIKPLPSSVPSSQSHFLSQSLTQSQSQSQTQIKCESASKSKGNELTSSLSKIAYKLLRTLLPSHANIEIKQRLYSTAFNCLTIIVAKTQSEEKFYDMFLFKEKNGECVWSKLIDCTVTYKFESDTEKFETSYLGCLQSVLGTGGRENKGGKIGLGMGRERGRGRGVRTGTGTGSYISQYLFGTILESSSIMTQSPHPFGSQSLGGKKNQNQSQNLGPGSTQKDYEELGLFSAPKFSQSQSQFQSQYDNNNNNGDNNNNENDVVRGLDDQVIALELNDLNLQQCMGSMVRVIQRMSTLFSSTDTPNNNNNNSSSSSVSNKNGKWRNDIMPNWIMEIRDRLSTYTHGSRNVRLFMLRLLLNQPVTHIVTPWILDLIPCVLECCLRDLCVGDVGTGYHYFLRDVVFTLCDSWALSISPSPSPSSSSSSSFSSSSSSSSSFPSSSTDQQGLDRNITAQTSQLISYLIKHSYCDTAEIVKENIKSVGALYRLFNGSTDSTGFTVSLAPVMVLLTVEAGPTGGANATAKSKGSEGVRKRLAGLLLLQVCTYIRAITSFSICIFHSLHNSFHFRALYPLLSPL